MRYVTVAYLEIMHNDNASEKRVSQVLEKAAKKQREKIDGRTSKKTIQPV